MNKLVSKIIILFLFFLINLNISQALENKKVWWVEENNKIIFYGYPNSYWKIDISKSYKPQESVLLQGMKDFINNTYKNSCEENYYCLNIELQKKIDLHKKSLQNAIKLKSWQKIKHYYYTTGYYEIQKNKLMKSIKKGEKENYEKKIEESKIDYSNFLPKKFTIAEEISMFFNGFKLFDEKNNKLDYRMDQKIWITTTLSLTNTKFNKKVASADKSLFSWGAEMNIYDKDGNSIGKIKEKVLSSMFKTYTSYIIYDKNDKVIWNSEKVEFWVTTIKIKDPKGNIIFTLKRGLFNIFTDDWSVEKNKEKAIDDRIVVFIAAFKTISDQEKEREEKEKTQ